MPSSNPRSPGFLLLLGRPPLGRGGRRFQGFGLVVWLEGGGGLHVLRVWGHLPLWWWRRRRKWFRSGYPINNKYTSFLLFPGLLNNESPSQEKLYLQKSIKKNLNKIFIFFLFFTCLVASFVEIVMPTGGMGRDGLNRGGE